VHLRILDELDVPLGERLPPPPMVVDLLRDAFVGAPARVVGVIDEATLPAQDERHGRFESGCRHSMLL
jgi:hypothetical protein